MVNLFKLLRGLAIATGLLACSLSARAQTTQLIQTAAGPNCRTYGCINTTLSDDELLTWSCTSASQKFSFRGLNYSKCSTSGNTAVDLDVTAWENNGFAVHTDFDVDCFRCAPGWDDGTFTVPNEYIGSGRFLYGWDGQVNQTSGNGQVGLVTATPYNQTVNLASGNPNLIQVPSQVIILAGSLDANFTITATAPYAPPSQTLSVTVTATFPDGTVAAMTVTVQPLPAPPPSSE